MEWTDETRSRLETALNESDVVGVRLDPSGTHVDVLLHALSLPEHGPLARDGRRVLRLLYPSELRFLLRQDLPGTGTAGQEALPLADLDAVEQFFDSLAWGGSIYGWRFFDEPELTGDWPNAPSLSVTVRETPAAHTFYWFNECAQGLGEANRSYCIEGTVSFDDLRVLDASGKTVPTDTFIADGVRQWDAFYEGDERLSVGSQREAQVDAPKWRTWASGGTSAMVPGGPPSASDVRTIQKQTSRRPTEIEHLRGFFTFRRRKK